MFKKKQQYSLTDSHSDAPSVKKSKSIKVCLTCDEYQLLANLADVDLKEDSTRLIGRRIAKYMRDQALGKPPVLIHPIAQEQWIALSHLASNLNQLTQYLHSGFDDAAVEAARLVNRIRDGLIGMTRADDES